MKTLHSLELVHCKDYFNQAKMFLGYSEWLKIKESASGLNRSISSNFLWLRSANHVKFTEECVMCRKKHVLVKKKSLLMG